MELLNVTSAYSHVRKLNGNKYHNSPSLSCAINRGKHRQAAKSMEGERERFIEGYDRKRAREGVI